MQDFQHSSCKHLQKGGIGRELNWRRVLLPVIERYRHLDTPKFFRGDVAFANSALHRLLEEEGYLYAMRLKANAILEWEIEHLLIQPIGHPSHKTKVFCHSFQYQAKSWHQPRRVVAKVEWHTGGQNSGCEEKSLRTTSVEARSGRSRA